MRGGNAIARAVVLQLWGRVAGIVLSFVQLYLTVRYLGPQSYGLLVTVLLFVGVFEALTELGVGTVVVRRVAAGQGTLQQLVGLSLGASIVYAAPLVLLAAGLGTVLYPDSPDVQRGIWIVALGLACSVIATCFEPVCQVTVRFGAVALADVLSRAASLALTVAIVAADGGLTALFAVQVLPQLVRMLTLLVWSRRHGPFRPVFALRPSLRLLRESLPFGAIIVIGVLYFRADGVLLSVLSSPVQVGAYGLAYRIAANLSVVGNVVTDAAFSTFAATWSRGRDSAYAEFNRSVGTCLQALLLCALPVAVFGPFLAAGFVELVGSAEFVEVATVPLALLFAAIAVGLVTVVLGQALAAAHEQRFLLRLNLVNLVLNIAVNIVLIPRYGAVGTAASLVLTELSGLLFAGLRLRRVSGLGLAPRVLVRLPLPLVVTAAAYAALPGTLPFPATLGVLALGYAVAVVLLGPLDRRSLRGLLRREDAAVAAG